MAKLRLPAQVAALPCFHALTLDEIIRMLSLLRERYLVLVGQRQNTFTPVEGGYNVSTVEFGPTAMRFVYYTNGRQVILIDLQVIRNMTLDALHDFLVITRVRYTEEPIEEGWMSSYCNPSGLQYAASSSLKTGKVVSAEYGIVPEEPQMEYDGPWVSGGSDVSNAQAMDQQIVPLLIRDHVVNSPQGPGIFVNLELTRAGVPGRNSLTATLGNAFQ
ncbi:hypothetical protein [Paraburkholderia lacunae]|uniref:Uncharacterized protein n=1 Tax=Paraburkholderia lacunae TaxID=2211104 RepID=A0A370N1S7_9BURK|nr:hypothetical protein [Paraburkholderia lacunae]RDJ99568.1 hypothetical protein DLM46_28275 [Paraburkholderia lacunae]